MQKIGTYLKNAFKGLLNDPWIVILDMIAVNLSHYLALLLRFYVNHEFRPTVSYYLADFAKFAPFYTVACIIIFALLRLYGGMWKYAGFNDLNRIIEASALTLIVQIFGSMIFVRRMPVTYYGVGASLQMIFILMIRFGYRFIVVEKRKISRRNLAYDNVVVVGAGENGIRMLRYLEDETTLKPVCIIDNSAAGKSLDGVPVSGVDSLEKTVDQNAAQAVIIADPLLEAYIKEEIKRICKKRGIDVKDYTGYLPYLGEDKQNLLDVVKAPTTMKVKGEEKRIISFSPPDISESEISEVDEALRSGWITTGPRTKLLERRLAAYIDTGRVDVNTEEDQSKWSNRVVCLNSATAAEELNLRILGIQEGDEVIVPAYTYTASASAAIHCGATVKFVDIQKDGDPVTHMPEMDYDALEAAITEKTKAIVTVDLGGIVCDYDRVFEIVKRKKNLFHPMESDGTPLSDLSAKIQKGIGCVAVVADCAHSLGASRKVSVVGTGKMAAAEKRYCGNIAHFTSFSFHAVKNFTTAEGGASTWCLPASVYENGVSNADIYKFYQLLSLHGQNKDALAKTKVGAWEYDIIGPWYKCNMTDIMAAIGLRQLDRYPKLLDRRIEIMKKYDAVCDELGISHLYHHVEGMDSSNHLYLIRLPGADVAKRNEFIEKMAQKGVATNVHYKPLPMMTAYKSLGCDIKDYPNTFDYYQNMLTLPLHTLLSDEDVEFVCQAVREVFSEK